MAKNPRLRKRSIKQESKVGRPSGENPFTRTEAAYLYRLMAELRISERALHENFLAADPLRRAISFEHFHRLIKINGERRPLVSGSRDLFAKAFGISQDVFSEYLETGDVKIVTAPREQISEMEKTAIWSELKSPTVWKAFLALKNGEELKMFFRDIMTENEIRELDMRWRVANMLDRGMTLSQINRKTKISPIVVKRIHRWLQHGCGGYRLLIKRVNGG